MGSTRSLGGFISSDLRSFLPARVFITRGALIPTPVTAPSKADSAKPLSKDMFFPWKYLSRTLPPNLETVSSIALVKLIAVSSPPVCNTRCPATANIVFCLA